MKIIHTSDWHLGRVIYGKSLLEDQQFFIESFFYPLLEAEKPDTIILSGDIFDRQIAPAEALRMFDSFVGHVCADLRLPLIAISGNHDGADRLGLGGRLLSSAGFHITTKLDTDAPPVVLKGEREVHIYSLPYFDPAMARDYTGDDSIRGFSDAYAEIVGRLKAGLDKSAFNILVSHCFVAGAQSSDSESPLFIGGSGETEPTVFDGFDYVALGHLHRPQRAGSNGRYSGSPLKYSFDEESHNKSVTVLDIGADSFETSQVPVTPLRDMRTLEGSLDELRAKAQTDPHKNDYIYAYLTGDPVFSPVEKLREFYPNTLGVRNGSIEQTAVSEKRASLKSSSPVTVFDEFLRQMCGAEPTDSDREIFTDAYTKAAGGGNN